MKLKLPAKQKWNTNPESENSNFEKLNPILNH